MSTQSTHKFVLVSHVLCPYVQRSVIALKELGVDYQRIDIDLADPPEWFREISPLGKVPLLIVDDDTVLFESAVIAEFISEVAGGGLLSDQPVEKAKQKAWMEFASATLDNIGRLYSAKDETAFEHALSALDEKWHIVDTNLKAGPFFSGPGFSLVDAAFGPVFRYLDLFEKILDRPLLPANSRVQSWRENLQARESVKQAVSPRYRQLLAEFVADLDSWMGKMAREFLSAEAAA